VKGLHAIGFALIAPLLSAQIIDVHEIIAASRQRIEASDFNATGHLIWVQPSGTRVSYPLTIKGHWFPGVLRIKAELGTGSKPAQGPTVAFHLPAHALIEMRPNGQNAIWIAHPGDKAPAMLPFDKWNEGPLGSSFSFEDFLEEQIFWPGQTLVEQTKFGARDCMVVKSTPGPGDKTHYSDVKTWFDRTIVFPVYIEKTVKGGVWSAHQVEMKTRGQAGSTFLVLDRGTTKANLTLNDFSPAQLTHF
jgi:Outer membrane lipoprotein-sorting protein